MLLWETFFLEFWRSHTRVPFWGHWYPCFGFLVTYPLGFKARVRSALFTFICRGECNVHSPRSTCGATPADLLTSIEVPQCKRSYNNSKFLYPERPPHSDVTIVSARRDQNVIDADVFLIQLHLIVLRLPLIFLRHRRPILCFSFLSTWSNIFFNLSVFETQIEKHFYVLILYT